jgi:hypothetical protein
LRVETPSLAVGLPHRSVIEVKDMSFGTMAGDERA